MDAVRNAGATAQEGSTSVVVEEHGGEARRGEPLQESPADGRREPASPEESWAARLVALRTRLSRAVAGDAGMSTTEYAIGTLSAAAFAALLYVIVSGDTVSGALEGLFERALSTRVG
ncbi:DUF4244 domain-containing protein [Dietzia sp.]|uniref:DUF4244 domain-containing protein n=1 Tax=Dietzia sp. TaxID=1871616 RepID=UPI002FDB908D